VWRLIRDELLRSTKLFVDETTAPVLDPGRGRTKKGYFWVLARDDRPWRSRAPPAVVYRYAPGRGGDHAAATPMGPTERKRGRPAGALRIGKAAIGSIAVGLQDAGIPLQQRCDEGLGLFLSQRAASSALLPRISASIS
jgi:hypothetical protein